METAFIIVFFILCIIFCLFGLAGLIYFVFFIIDLIHETDAYEYLKRRRQKKS